MHIMDTPSVGPVVAHGRLSTTITIINLAVSINVVDRITGSKKALIGKITILTKILNGTGISGTISCARGQFPLSLSRVIVSPAPISATSLCLIFMPLVQLLRHRVHTTDTRRAKMLVAPAIKLGIIHA